MRKIDIPTIRCVAIRPLTRSSIEVEIPSEIAQAIVHDHFDNKNKTKQPGLLDLTKAIEWIGNEFNYQFVPQAFSFETTN